MNHFQDAMNHAVQTFVVRIAELARGAALHCLRSAFSPEWARSSAAARSSGLSASARRGRTDAAALPRRSTVDLEAVSKRFLSFVETNPGLRIEQINKQLGTTTKELVHPVRKLVAERKISTRYHKRATIYFATRSLEVTHGQPMATAVDEQGN